MLRRFVLKALLGGAVAAPTLARQTVAQAMGVTDLSLAGIVAGGAEGPAPAPMGHAGYSDLEYQRSILGLLSNRTGEQHRFHLLRTDVYALDPDLASYGSFSLSAKIALQRQRNYERGLASRKGWLEAKISGFLSEYD